MQQLRYHDEIRSFSEVPLGDAQVKAPELKLALQIVDQAVSDTFRPQDHRDEVRKAVEEAIQDKVDGREITAEPAEEPKAQVIDLMAALKASLGDGQRKPAKRSPRKTKVSKKTKKAAGKRAR
jgi:DNA end-binding protein Ku